MRPDHQPGGDRGMSARLPSPGGSSQGNRPSPAISRRRPAQAAVGGNGTHQAPPGLLLARLGETLAEAAQICRALAEVQLAGSEKPRLMEGVHSAKPLLSVRDLAARLNIHPRTVRRWRGEGKLPPALEVGGVVRWQAEVVDAWIEGEGRG